MSVDRYAVDLDVSGTGPTFASSTTIHFQVVDPAAGTFVDLIAAEVEAVVLNGRSLAVEDVVAHSRVTLDCLAAENVLTVRARCAYMNTGEGLHRFVDPVDGLTYLYTQLGPANARRVFAVFEQPDLKAVFEVTVRAPAGWVVVGNAAVTATSPAPEDDGDDGGSGSDASADAVVWRFAATARISPYLVAVVAGPYHHVHEVHPGRGGAIPLGLYCRRSVAAHLDAGELFDLTRRGFGFYEERFGMAYPFGKYDQVFVPEFNWGAVENVACVTFHDRYLFRSRQLTAAYEQRANVVLHELAHMWFGDLVTMRWWDDVWLNESFAEWAGHWASVAATRFTDAWVDFAARKAWAYRADQLPSTHPVADDIVDLAAAETAFDGITYAKGASVVRQLVAHVGEDMFVTGLRAYFAAHAFATAEFADLLRAVESASGRNLSDWAARWLRTSGVNTLRPVLEVDTAGRYTAVAVEQTAAAGPDPVLRPHRLAVGLYDATPAGLVRRVRVEVDVAGPVTAVPDLNGAAAADLVLVNDGDLTYAKVRFDPRSLQLISARVGEVADPLTRSLCWTALWDMTRDGEYPPTRWVSTVLTGIRTETGVAALQLLLSQAGVGVDTYVRPDRRGGLRAEWTAGLRELLHQAEPGGDRQLALTLAVAVSATTTSDHRLLQGLLDGSTDLPGLVVDADLRWALLTGLARAGVAGVAAIDDELAGDTTNKGREHAASAHAARPDPAAKAAAWRAAVESDDLPNQVLTATVDGFTQPGQEHLLRPYLHRYFEVAAAIGATRTPMTAQHLLTGLFPRYLPPEEVVPATQQWLATTDAGPAARRVVSEGCADAARALTAQHRDQPDPAPDGSSTSRYALPTRLASGRPG